MKLIVGLGNPGKNYKNTRHNIGFAIIDTICQNERFSPWRMEKKYQAEISDGHVVTQTAILAKPQTFMNNSGEAVELLIKYYKIPVSDIMVIHDDLDLPIGTIRISQNASSGGHRGIQSIIDHLQTQAFVRFRFGIAGEEKGAMPEEKYVLQKFSSSEQLKIDSATNLIIEAIEYSITVGVAEAKNKFN